MLSWVATGKAQSQSAPTSKTRRTEGGRFRSALSILEEYKEEYTVGCPCVYTLLDVLSSYGILKDMLPTEMGGRVQYKQSE